MSDIMVYFNSGNKERFSLNKIRFVEQYPGKDAFDDGRTVINWNSVTFIHAVPDREEDAE